jgi:hypothetical protein
MAQFIDIVEEYRDWIITQANKAIDPKFAVDKKKWFLFNQTAGSVKTFSVLSIENSSLVAAIAKAIS